MKETEIRRYAELMRELGLTALEITEESGKVRLERSAPSVTKETAAQAPDAGAAQQSPNGEAAGDASIRSPLVGVFYAAPAENANPYVRVGDAVRKGQTLCIIEAMKLMNEVTAEEDGVISAVCATNGQVVEYGTELFRVKR